MSDVSVNIDDLFTSQGGSLFSDQTVGVNKTLRAGQTYDVPRTSYVNSKSK